MFAFLVICNEFRENSIKYLDEVALLGIKLVFSGLKTENRYYTSGKRSEEYPLSI